MKSLIHLVVITVAVLVAQCARADTYTNYLDNVQAVLQAGLADPSTPEPARRLIAKALKRFDATSTSVAGDYGIFLAVTTDLLPLQGQGGTEILSQTLSNSFTNFVFEAQAQIMGLGGRIAAITPFQRSRVAAANNLNQAVRALSTVTNTSDLRIGLLSVRLAYAKIAVASKLTAKAEANQGAAVDSLAGHALSYETKSGESDTLALTGEGTYSSTQASGDSGTYTYTRTGLDGGELVLNGPDGTTTVKLRFTSRSSTGTEGTFSFKFQPDSGGTESGSGTFTTTTE